jgi:hypothetical protein
VLYTKSNDLLHSTIPSIAGWHSKGTSPLK